MTAAPKHPASSRENGGVQSIARVFGLLEAMADAGGIATVSQLAELSGLPLPTIHRLLQTLVSLGYARQEPSREYALGPRLVRLGESANRLVESWAAPYLRRLADDLGETASLAFLDGANVVYVAQASGHHSMRMITEIGQRVGIHCTAAGKALLATLPPEKAQALAEKAELHAYTQRTITSVDALMRELDAVRDRGYALDEGEQEIGVTAVAVALPGAPARGAVTITGPATRLGDDIVARAVPVLVNAARELSRELALMRR
jgi:IclR family acetate operon transcriptional repressor